MRELICIGGQEDGRKVAIARGRSVRFPKKTMQKTTDPWPDANEPVKAEFIDYELRLINFKDGASVEFLSPPELSTSRAVRALLDAYTARSR